MIPRTPNLKSKRRRATNEDTGSLQRKTLCRNKRIGEHFGNYCTNRCLATNLYWVGMSSAMHKFVQGCKICQRSNSCTLAQGGFLQSLEIPDIIWEQVSIDFISGLPRSRGYDTIYPIFFFLIDKKQCIEQKRTKVTRSTQEMYKREPRGRQETAE